MRLVIIILVACGSGRAPAPVTSSPPPATVVDAGVVTLVDGGDGVDARTAVETWGPPPEHEQVWRRFAGIDVVETVNHAHYEHGGPPAKLYSAYINFVVRDRRAHTIVVKKLSVVFDNCSKPTRADVQVRKVIGLALHGWEDMEPIATGVSKVVVAAGDPRRVGVHIRFDGLETREACGLVIEVAIDGTPATLKLPLAIYRIQPLRPDENDPF